MRTTYARVMSGSTITAPAIGKRWVYLLVATTVMLIPVLARSETGALMSSPAGLAVVIAVVAGFVARKSMALTPWALVTAGVVLYAIERGLTSGSTALAVAQLCCFVIAAGVGLFQMRVRLDGGAAAARPPRARWGSVLVAGTTCVVVIILSRPDAVLLEWVRDEQRSTARIEAAVSAFSIPQKIGYLHDPTIIESSGLVAAGGATRALWTHNDSGAPYLYCIYPRGRSCGAWEVSGAANRDWEDIAAGPGPVAGVRYLYIGDIGDNFRAADAVTVYRIAEPDRSTVHTGIVATAPANAITLRYPDGAHDAEALIVHPGTGDIYIITKELTSKVYRAAAPLAGSSVVTLEKVATFSIFANFADLTGADLAPDGRHLAIATYGGWYELVLPPAVSESPTTPDFNDIWTTKPTLIGSRLGTQWESIAYRNGGAALFMTSEGAGSDIYRARRADD